jgi:hypothetical protein
MYKRIRRLLIVVLVCLLQSHTADAQDLDVGFTGGGCYYLGDLNPGRHFINSQISYGVLARYTLDTRWAVKVSGQFGNIMGSCASTSYLPERGLSFSSSITDIAGTVEFNFMPYFTGSRMNSISPYIYTGISVFFFNPKYNGVSLRSIGTEGQNIGYEGRTPYGSVSVSIPFGAGVKYSLSKRIGLSAYWEMHKTFNDYLDDVSTTYYLDGTQVVPGDESGAISDPTLNHKPGMQRGNASNNDWFAFFGVAITYKFNLLASKKCREVDH